MKQYHRYSGSNVPRKPASAKPTTLDLSGDWKACTKTIPKSCKVIGTVTDGGKTGALVQLAETQAYVMVREGKVSVLNQATITRLIKAATAQDEGREMISVEEWENDQ